MKFLFALLVPFVLCQSCIVQPTAEEEIFEVLMLQQNAWNQGDVNEFMTYYYSSEELTFAGENGVVKGHQQVLNRYLKNYDTPEKMGTLEFTILEFRQLSDDSAYLVGKWDLERASDNPSGYFTLVWQKVDGEWKIIHDHTS